MKKMYALAIFASLILGSCSKEEENIVKPQEVPTFDLLLKDNALMAYYPFTGSADDSKNSYHGSVVGYELISDRKSKDDSAYKSNSSNSEISFPANIPFKNESFSISFWFKVPVTTLNGFYTILSKREECTRGNFIQVVYKKGENKLTVEMRSDNVADDFTGSATASLENINQSEWMHVVITKDNTTKKTNIYINGTEKISTPWSDQSKVVSIDNSAKFIIGSSPCNATSTLRNFIGSIDDIMLFNKVLTTEEITILKDN